MPVGMMSMLNGPDVICRETHDEKPHTLLILISVLVAARPDRRPTTRPGPVKPQKAWSGRLIPLRKYLPPLYVDNALTEPWVGIVATYHSDGLRHAGRAGGRSSVCQPSKRRLAREMAGEFLANGRPVPPEVWEVFAGDTSARSHLRKGMVMLGTGIGIFLSFRLMGHVGAAYLGLIPLFIGIAQLLIWRSNGIPISGMIVQSLSFTTSRKRRRADPRLRQTATIGPSRSWCAATSRGCAILAAAHRIRRGAGDDIAGDFTKPTGT